jgi:hypothetical protein
LSIARVNRVACPAARRLPLCAPAYDPAPDALVAASLAATVGEAL